MDKRTLLGGGVASVAVLAVCMGGWINARRTSALDAPLPPGAVQFNAGNAPAAPLPLPSAEPAKTAAENLPTVAPSASPAPVATATPTEIAVYVTGGVKKPGVYHLKPGARIESAIFAAGGFKPNAQTDALNLADFAQDGDQLVVPVSHGTPAAAPAATTTAPPPTATIIARAANDQHPAPAPVKRGRVLGKPAAPPPAPIAAATSAGNDTDATSDAPTERSTSHHRATSNKLKNPGDGIINLNTASAEELARLPGVGAATAQHILDYRQQIGQFSDPSQIQAVKGIGPKKYAKMQPFVSVK